VSKSIKNEIVSATILNRPQLRGRRRTPFSQRQASRTYVVMGKPSLQSKHLAYDYERKKQKEQY